jgi:hypothetical protein
MAHDPYRRCRAIFCSALALGTGSWLACEAPDGSDLYDPRPSGAGGSVAGSSGSGGAAGAAGRAGAGSGAGEGGAGRAGSASTGGSSASGGGGSADAAAPVPALDAGSEEDASFQPPCAGPSAEVCDGRDNDCDGVVDPGVTCAAECAGFALAEQGYMFCAEPVDRGIALARCEAQGMKLAWLEDAEENEAVVLRITELELADGAGELLTQIGASDGEDDGEWLWVGNGAALDGFQFWEGTSADDDGEAVAGAYQNWADGEPNDQDDEEDCGVVSVLGSENRDPGQWDDRNCDEEFAFVCEVP